MSSSLLTGLLLTSLASLVSAKFSIPILKNNYRGKDSIHADLVSTYQRYNWVVPDSAKALVRRSYETGLGDDAFDSSYYAGITVGTPPVQYIVNLDTSTTSFTLAGSSFANETGSIPAYSPAQSSSSQQTPLTFTSSRMGGIGSSGVIVNDKVAMGSYAAFQNIEVFNVSSNSDVTNYVFGAISGYLGLQHVDAAGNFGFLAALFNAGQFAPGDSPEFGLALALQYDPYTESPAPYQDASGGFMIVGGVDSSLFYPTIEYIPTCDPLAWAIPLNDIVFGGVSTGLSSTCVTLDTGTTAMYLPADMVAKVYSKVPGATIQPDGLTYVFPCAGVNGTTISLTFGSQTYFIEMYDFAHVYDSVANTCVGSLIVSNGNAALIGTVFLKNVYASYRMSSPRSVGLAFIYDLDYRLESSAVPYSNSSTFASHNITGHKVAPITTSTIAGTPGGSGSVGSLFGSSGTSSGRASVVPVFTSLNSSDPITSASAVANSTVVDPVNLAGPTPPTAANDPVTNSTSSNPPASDLPAPSYVDPYQSPSLFNATTPSQSQNDLFNATTPSQPQNDSSSTPSNPLPAVPAPADPQITPYVEYNCTTTDAQGDMSSFNSSADITGSDPISMNTTACSFEQPVTPMRRRSKRRI